MSSRHLYLRSGVATCTSISVYQERITSQICHKLLLLCIQIIVLIHFCSYYAQDRQIVDIYEEECRKPFAVTSNAFKICDFFETIGSVFAIIEIVCGLNLPSEDDVVEKLRPKARFTSKMLLLSAVRDSGYTMRSA